MVVGLKATFPCRWRNKGKGKSARDSIGFFIQQVEFGDAMSFLEWVKKEWHVIEGHAKWDFYKWVFGLFLVAGAAALTLGAYLVHRLRYGPDWLPYAVGFVLALLVFFWMGNRLTTTSSNPTATQSPRAVHRAKLNPHDPDLRAEIQEILFHLKRLPISNDVFVLLRVSVVNHGESEAVVTRWDLTVEVGDEQIECEEEEIPADWRIRRINPAGRLKVTTEDFNRDASTFGEPLRRGVPKERWVCFRLPSLIMRLLPPHNAKLILTLTDAFGRTHVTEGGPGFSDETGEIVEDGELSPSPPRSAVLTESVIEKIEKVGNLRSLAGRAEFLRDYLEEVWHNFLKEKKNMPNPIGKNSVPDAISEWTDKQLWRFRARYQDYLGSMEAVEPDCESDLVKDGFPHEGEDYLSVERKIKEHAATLRKRADDLLTKVRSEGFS